MYYLGSSQNGAPVLAPGIGNTGRFWQQRQKGRVASPTVSKRKVRDPKKGDCHMN